VADDPLLRLAAFREVRRLADANGDLTSRDLRAGFSFEGARIPLINPQRGIFKPTQMRFLLSIRTVFPRPGARVWYDDQRQLHRQIYEGDEAVDYAFMGGSADAAENRWLREAMQDAVPIIYFLGTSPAVYKALIPSFVIGWDAASLKARIAFSAGDELRAPETAAERRYALRQVKQRLHQATFREAVITAYRGRCALSGLREPVLLDAAHIIEDKHEQLGQPVVRNGIPLAKTHHAAFDAHLIGIDADFRIHVSRRILEQKDGPTLEALKRLHLNRIYLPARGKDRPDQDRLAMRFEQFKERLEARYREVFRFGREFLELLEAHRELREELGELADILAEQTELPVRRIPGLPEEWPLLLYGRCEIREILTAVGWLSESRRTPFRAENGWRFFLFVRENKEAAYCALGPATMGPHRRRPADVAALEARGRAADGVVPGVQRVAGLEPKFGL